MRITVARNPREMGEEAARLAAETLNRAVREKGWARMALSTGASQLDTMAALVKCQAPWRSVEVFQVNERAGLTDEQAASCRRALKDRFVRRLPLGGAHYMDGSEESVRRIGMELRKAPLDLILLGIGEQGQIGFNTAPADFENHEPYALISTGEELLATMTVCEILRAGHIIACAPYGLSAETVYQVVKSQRTEELPATALKRHAQFDLMLDADSAERISVGLAAECNPELEMYRMINGQI